MIIFTKINKADKMRHIQQMYVVYVAFYQPYK